MPETTETQRENELGQLGLEVQTDTNDVSGLPAEMVNRLDQFEEGSRQIFIAAFKSAQRDASSDQDAMQIAWDTVKADYEQGEDGKWRLCQRQVAGIHNNPTQSAGN